MKPFSLYLYILLVFISFVYDESCSFFKYVTNLDYVVRTVPTSSRDMAV